MFEQFDALKIQNRALIEGFELQFVVLTNIRNGVEDPKDLAAKAIDDLDKLCERAAREVAEVKHGQEARTNGR